MAAPETKALRLLIILLPRDLTEPILLPRPTAPAPNGVLGSRARRPAPGIITVPGTTTAAEAIAATVIAAV